MIMINDKPMLLIADQSQNFQILDPLTVLLW